MVFTFDAFNQSVQVTVPLINDDVNELTEVFIASLNFTEDVPPRTTIAPDNATITIIDDDSMLIIYCYMHNKRTTPL